MSNYFWGFTGNDFQFPLDVGIKYTYGIFNLPKKSVKKKREALNWQTPKVNSSIVSKKHTKLYNRSIGGT